MLVNIPWTKGATFASICTNVLLRHTIGGIDYWVCYGTPGDTGEVTLKGGKPVEFTYPAGDTVSEIDLESGDGSKACLLVMNTMLTKKTWLANGVLSIGPSFVREDGALEFLPEGGTATIYSAAGKKVVTAPAVTAPAMPALAAWTWRDAAPERSGTYPVSGWSQSKGPQPMESYDGFQNRYGWYRTVVRRDAPRGGRVEDSRVNPASSEAFLNGEPASLDHLDLKAGDNTLAINAKVDPRPTLYNFVGPIGLRESRGLWGNVSEKGVGDATWYFRGGLDALDETPVIGRVLDLEVYFLAHAACNSPDHAATPGIPAFWKTSLRVAWRSAVSHQTPRPRLQKG